jgi:hypothetical protein
VSLWVEWPVESLYPVRVQVAYQLVRRVKASSATHGARKSYSDAALPRNRSGSDPCPSGAVDAQTLTLIIWSFLRRLLRKLVLTRVVPIPQILSLLDLFKSNPMRRVGHCVPRIFLNVIAPRATSPRKA